MKAKTLKEYLREYNLSEGWFIENINGIIDPNKTMEFLGQDEYGKNHYYIDGYIWHDTDSAIGYLAQYQDPKNAKSEELEGYILN